MRRNLLASLFCFLFALILAACAGQQSASQNSATTNAPNENAKTTAAQTPPAQIVHPEVVVATEIAPGGTTEAVVRVTVSDSYHINANPPTYAYLKATQLDVAPANNISVTGRIVYPLAQTKKFSFDPTPLAVYEGAVEIKVPLRASNDAAKGSFSLTGRLQVQPCDDQQCYPPRTIDVSIPVTIK